MSSTSLHECNEQMVNKIRISDKVFFITRYDWLLFAAKDKIILDFMQEYGIGFNVY